MLGTYEHTMDAKGRMNFPAKIREECGEHFYITKDIKEKCLTVYTEQGWEALKEKLRSKSQSVALPLERYLFGSACEAEPDKQGRIAIPAHLRAYAQIQSEVLVVGVGERAEIWNKELWEDYLERTSAQDIEALAGELEI
ncbi:MAG: division/cell wall cluster transcriptional repressor MraZ [Oscillospiraceae bacterium]